MRRANAYPELVAALEQCARIAEAIDRGDDNVPQYMREKTVRDIYGLTRALRTKESIMNMYRPTARDAIASRKAIRLHNAASIDLTTDELRAVYLVAAAYDRDECVSLRIIGRAHDAIATSRSIT